MKRIAKKGISYLLAICTAILMSLSSLATNASVENTIILAVNAAENSAAYTARDDEGTLLGAVDYAVGNDSIAILNSATNTIFCIKTTHCSQVLT